MVGFDASASLAATENLGAAYVPSGEVGQCALPFVLELDARDSADRWRQRAMNAVPRLDARLLVSAEDIVVGPKRLAVPDPLVQIEHPAGFLSERRVAREDPTAN
jgi:hypothetical protein